MNKSQLLEKQRDYILRLESHREELGAKNDALKKEDEALKKQIELLNQYERDLRRIFIINGVLADKVQELSLHLGNTGLIGIDTQRGLIK